MKERTIATLALAIAFVVLHAETVRAMELSFTSPQLYAQNDAVKVEVRATGTVLITSDFDMQSRQIDVTGAKTVEVGKVSVIGPYRIAASDGVNEVALDVLVLPEGSKFRFVASTTKATRARTATVVDDERALMKRFLEHVDGPKAKVALGKAAASWAQSNAVNISTTVITCILTFEEPFAAKYCKSGAFDAAGDVGIEFLEKLVGEVENHGITKGDADTLRAWIKLGKVLRLVKLEQKDLEKLDELFSRLSSTIDSIEFKDERVKIVLKTGVDLARKYVVILTIAKP